MSASQGGSTPLELDVDLPLDDTEINNNSQQDANDQIATRTEKTESWWSVGEYLEGRGLTHQSAKFTLTGNRVFGPQQNPDDVWDLTDSLFELYEKSQKEDATATTPNGTEVEGPDVPLDADVSVEDWLEDDRSHGFIRVHPASLGNVHIGRSQLVPCALNTSAHRVCLMLGTSINALHVQLHGDVIRRMDPYEHPLALQNELLAGLGYNDLARIQLKGATADLSYLIRFYSGKPLYDSTFSRNQLQACIDVKKGGIMQNWVRKMCVLSGTRLLIYKDKYKRSQPSFVQLAKGSVEETQMKGHDNCLKLTISVGGERVIWLSFNDPAEYNKWFRRCKKATDKLPTTADLSNCHLEFLPENLFINEQLAMLNLRHNVLRERPLDEDAYTIGWLDDLHRFRCLRSLNLADNNLCQFPPSLCSLKTLVELNIASNRLEEIPADVQLLSNLQALHVHNNHLSTLPLELLTLRKLFILVLAFNRFTILPPVVAQMTNVRTSEVENIIMAGNEIDRIPSETLMEMKYVKKVDLRMNQLTLNATETMKLTVLEHLTHLDLRDNQVTDLDIRSLRTLEYLNVERNDMLSLQANGMALKNLFASHNCIERLVINPKPEWLLQMDVSYNCLQLLPDWLSDCFFLQKLWVGCNVLTQLPPRLLNEARKLKSLRANHNHLATLPPVDFEGSLSLEEVLLHHNQLTSLPASFLLRANKLRVLNLTKNRLSTLPPLNANRDLNRVQELYLSGNSLGDSVLGVVAEYTRLKILHLSHNEIYSMSDLDVSKLELIQELNISGNQLRQLPAAIGHLPRLVVLRAHSNILHSLPDFKHATALRILDVGHNQLLNVSVTHLMASQLNLLDMSLNAQLKVDPKEFKSVKHHKKVCLVDLTGQNRLLPGLKSRRKPMSIEGPLSPPPQELHTISRTTDISDMDSDIPWKVGFSETAGMRNKLCVATLKMLQFRSENECVFGMFDGGYNNDVPSLLLKNMEEILNTEIQNERTGHSYLKYAMLSAHSNLKATGQRLGASALLCHMHRVASADTIKHYTLSIANVGDVEAVLCRHGDALLLTRKFVTDEDRDECQRVFKSDGIITEDNKVNGTTKNTRLLGCGYLYPHVIPDPYTNTIALRNDDEFIIIANRGLWHYVTYTEAVEEIYETGNPVVAAKQLQDIAQAYGCKENISILVVRLNTDKGPSLARLRQNHSMSIDDVEAAVKHEAKLQKHWQKRAAKEQRHRGIEHVPTTLIEETPPPPPPKDYTTVEEVTATNGVATPPPPPEDTIVKQKDFVDNLPPPPEELLTPDTPEPKALKPLPNQRYLKKTAATEWEVLLQSRLSQEVKDLEMKQFSSSVLENLGFETYQAPAAPPSPPTPQLDMHGSVKRPLTTPWSTTDENIGGSNSPLMRDNPRRAKTRGSIANTIALFENLSPVQRRGGMRSVSVPRERVTSSPVTSTRQRPRSPPPVMMATRPSVSPFQKGQPKVSLEQLSPITSPSSPPPTLPPKPAKSSLRVKTNGVYHASPTSKVATPSPKVATPTSKVATPSPKVATPTFNVATPSPKVATPPPKVATPTFKVATPLLNKAPPKNEPHRNVSNLVKMFGTESPGKLNESVEIQHVDASGSVHFFEVAKL